MINLTPSEGAVYWYIKQGSIFITGCTELGQVTATGHNNLVSGSEDEVAADLLDKHKNLLRSVSRNKERRDLKEEEKTAGYDRKQEIGLLIAAMDSEATMEYGFQEQEDGTIKFHRPS